MLANFAQPQTLSLSLGPLGPLDQLGHINSSTDDDLVRKSVKRIMSLCLRLRLRLARPIWGNLLANDLAEFVNIVKENFVFGHFE